MRGKKGFTLIEMLIVIAIIAILVAVVVPAMTNATKRARAAADAANLRAIYGQANTLITSDDVEQANITLSGSNVKCASYPDAEMFIAYSYPGFIYIFFYDNGSYYDLDYFSDIAETGSSEHPTDSSSLPTNADISYYNITAGAWSTPAS